MYTCHRDNVPVGVFRQVRTTPSTYHIFGLALVKSWDDVYFYLEGFTSRGHTYDGDGDSRAEIEAFATKYRSNPEPVDSFNPHDNTDARKKIMATIVQRQGQPEFRQTLLKNYNERCALSGCDVVDVLEAAHIKPYRGEHTNHASNGLLLRADLHTLFDLGLISIDTQTMTVILSPELENTAYHEFSGVGMYLPTEESAKPSREALDEHRSRAGL